MGSILFPEGSGRGLLFAAALLVLGAASAGASSFTPLGDLPGGDTYSKAFGVSDNGRFVVGDGRSTRGVEGFRYDAKTGQMIPLIGDTLANPYATHARAISNDGTRTAGWYTVGDLFVLGQDWYTYAGLWDQSGNVVVGSIDAGFFDITPDGAKAVGWQYSQMVAQTADAEYPIPNYPPQMIAWQEGDHYPLPSLGAAAFGEAVSSDGTAFAGTSFNDLTQIYQALFLDGTSGEVDLGTLWDGTGQTPPTTPWSFGHGISPDGTRVVGSADSPEGRQAFVWDATHGMVGLGDLGADAVVSSEAFAISEGGRIVGTADDDGVTKAFIYDDALGGMMSLEDFLTLQGIDFSGYQLVTANDISADGNYIVGSAKNLATGYTEAFLVAVPEPGIGTLLGVSLCVLGLMKRSDRLARRRATPHAAGRV